MTPVFALFHLNLAFSSIPAQQRGEVIARCYTPLLDLVEQRQLPLGIELTGWTLRRIQEIDPNWVTRFRQLLNDGQCELIGSGYTQIIGPLVPYEVNQWNQRLGLDCYDDLLAVKPRLVLVNEMAYSSGMVEVYRDAGYQGMVMDRDNIMLSLGLSGAQRLPSSFARGCTGQELPVLWSDTVLFQRLQRYAHGDISRDEFLKYFTQRAVRSIDPLPLYCNDAEVFDFRPGRFSEETVPHQQNEWARLALLFDTLVKDHQAHWYKPSAALELQCQADEPSHKALTLTSPVLPIPVKKQAKYNISRWAVTGRDDLRMNTLCHRLHDKLAGSQQRGNWHLLCELWASDLRTHIGEERWQQAQQKMKDLAQQLGLELTHFGLAAAANEPPTNPEALGFDVSLDHDGILLTIRHKTMVLVLNIRRGLSIESLAFRSHHFESVVGTLPQGYFDSIELAADFYSGSLVIEMPKTHRRWTDLNWVKPVIEVRDELLLISVFHDTPYGRIKKVMTLNPSDESVSLGIELDGWCQPHSIVRLHAATLLQGWQDAVTVQTRNGGPQVEHFDLAGLIEHSHPASSMVSCTTGLGGESGRVVLHRGDQKLSLNWDTGQCAAFPMLYHRPCSPGALSRVKFSLGEIDETLQNGGFIPPFSFRFSPE